MKLITFLFLASTLALSATSYSQVTKIDLSFRDSTSLTEILGSIEKNTEFIFIYDASIVNMNAKKTISANAQKIETVLDKLFQGTDVAYLIDDRQVFLYQKDHLETLNVLQKLDEPGIVLQQNIFSGTIKDAGTGEPLIGVTVVVKGTTIGTVTDINGKFTLKSSENTPILAFSFIGYKPQEISATQGKEVTVMMSLDVVQISEVVVVGYGVQRKESVVGAVSSTSGEALKKSVQGADLGTGLTGSMPGLTIIQTTGVPGGRDADNNLATIYIRGKKTWNNAAPLILVDGVERPFNDIDPNEIDKISVLKDASATAVFGVKGANGVILITTKRGKEGRPKLSFEVSNTVKVISKVVTGRLNSYDANLLRNYTLLNEVPYNEASWNYIVPSKWLQYYKTQQYPEYFPDVNWVDSFTKKFATDQNISMTVTGGTKVVKYFASLAYLKQGDILNLKDEGQGYTPNYQFDRYNFRSNLDFDITPTTRFSASLSGFFSNQKEPAGSKFTAWMSFYSRPPDLYPPKYSDGTYADYTGYSRYINGLMLLNFYGYSLTKATQINTDFSLTQKLDFIIKGLSANAKFSFDNLTNTTGPNITGYGVAAKYIQPQIVQEITPGMNADQIRELEQKYTIWQLPQTGNTTGYDWALLPNTYSGEAASTNVERVTYYQASLNYQRDFGKHAVGGLFLFSRQVTAAGSVFPGYREDWVGRGTYGYDDRYLLEFNGAYNGSEKFSNKYRFGFFPSLAIGWVISKEAFFENLKPVVSLLKFRYSDGVVGSDEGIARWLYVGSWQVPTTTISFGTPTVQAGYPLRYEGTIPNADIQWETSHKRDFGVESGFFNDQFKVMFDYFQEKRSNIFVAGSALSVAEYFGAVPVAINKGRVNLHGWELELLFSRTTPGGLRYWFNHQWSYSIDKIIEKGDPPLKPTYQKVAGFAIDQPRSVIPQSLNSVRNTWDDIYNSVGVTNNMILLPGDFNLVDYNSDGVVNSNDAVPVGYTERPQYTFSPSAGIAYKNLSANLKFYGVYNIESSTEVLYMGAFREQYNNVYPWNVQYSWSPEYNVTTNAVNSGLRFMTTPTSGYFTWPRNYLRLQHVEIAYLLSTPWIKKYGIPNVRFRLSGENLVLWSHMFEDMDTKRETSETTVQRAYPRFKMITFGLGFDIQ